MAHMLERRGMGLKKLTKGESATAVVRAAQYWNPTGIEIGYLEAYAVEAEGEWDDWGRRSDADGQPGNFFQELFQGAKRCGEAQWFQLVGSVGASDDRMVPLGTFARWTSHSLEAGELFLFANDAPGFYWNNAGELKVRITRIS
jgi:hypothetical protein